MFLDLTKDADTTNYQQQCVRAKNNAAEVEQLDVCLEWLAGFGRPRW